MHILFTKLRYKNILSVGNHFIELDLTGNRTTLISGTNGAGKSTMIEAIVFALYGKSFRRINKPQLINSINQKELLIELEFTIGNDKYMIRRGMRPGIFEIWKNSELLNKDAAARDYQVYLEQNIIKMSFKSFSQIVILGSATYVPFMELPTGQRREIIEDLLDIQIFSTMNILLKERISENKTSISDNNYAVGLVESKIESAKEHNAEIQRIKHTEVVKIRAKIAENLEKIEVENLKMAAAQTEIDGLFALMTDKDKQSKLYSEFEKLTYDLTNKKKSNNTEIQFYSKHDNCPTCKQGIEHDFKLNILEDRNSKNKELEDGMEQLNLKLDSIRDRLKVISDLETKISGYQVIINEAKLSIRMIMGQMSTYKKDLENAEKEFEEIDKSKISEFTNQRKDLQKEQTALYEHRETLGIVAAMLKDGGIKTSIIKTYIPVMNKLINQFLSEFELFVDFNLDENFNETIKSRFRDAFSFASFSEGEKMRISLSILFTWRAVAKLRNSVSTNLLIMDEIFDGSSDSDGITALIEILQKMNAGDNIFVISHRGEQFSEKFDHSIKFDKVKNFTEVAA